MAKRLNDSSFTGIAPPELIASVATILSDAQLSLAAQKKCLTKMSTLYDEWAPDNDAAGVRQFAAAYVACLRRVLVVFKREKCVERLIEFTSTFLSAHCEGEASLHSQITHFLVKTSSVKDKAVRFRCSQLLSSLMNSLPDEAEIE